MGTTTMADKDEQLAQFQSITGCDADRAQFYLESSNWQLDLAMASFYEGDGDDAGMEVGGSGAPAPAAAPTPAENVPSASGGHINFVSDDQDDDGDSEQQAFYAGGSTNSGNMILGPKKKKVTNVGDFFKAFKEAGAVPVDPSETGESSSGARAFSGGGFRLGSDETPSTKIGGASAAPKEEKPRRFVLKMWRDGFSIDDGDIRLYNDPQHREFLQSDMEDHRDEEFVKPKVKAKPFQGTGNVLGSIAPS